MGARQLSCRQHRGLLMGLSASSSRWRAIASEHVVLSALVVWQREWRFNNSVECWLLVRRVPRVYLTRMLSGGRCLVLRRMDALL